MIYTDSKGREHKVKEMGTFHLANAIKKHREEIERFNAALLQEMEAELATREDHVLPADQVPKVRFDGLVNGSQKLSLDRKRGQDTINDEF